MTHRLLAGFSSCANPVIENRTTQAKAAFANNENFRLILPLQVDDLIQSAPQTSSANACSNCCSTIDVMPDNSFDVVSIVDLPEVLNALQQARKEVQTRFDLKDTKSEIELNEKDKKLVIQSVDDFKLKAVVEIVQQKLAKRKVPLKNFSYGPITPAAGSTVRQEIAIQSGIPIEKSREIVKKIKDSKIKVQASIQGDLVRVSGKSRDLLQAVIQLLKGSDFGLELQFTNYPTF